MPKQKNLISDNIDFHLTHPERVVYPEGQITKLEIAIYYSQVKDWMLPYVAKRPLTLVRCPAGMSGECFYQKHLGTNQSKSLFSIKIKETEGVGVYSYLKDEKGLYALVQIGALEIHTWGSHVSTVEKPDMIIFDLDPAPDVAWKKVIKAACVVREHLQSIHLQSFVKTTGGKGLHVVVPIKPSLPWLEIKELSHAFVNSLVEMYPNDYVSVMTKEKRKGKIFIDYLRNQRGATAVAPYSTRARANASVSMPLAWDELTTKIKSDSFTIKNAVKHLNKLKQDPWEEFLQIKQIIQF